MTQTREHRALLAVDIAHSAGRGDVALHRIREALSRSLAESFELSGIDWHACLRDDLGDGMRVTTPPGTPKTRLIHPLVHDLTARLRAHNRLAAPPARVRVRIALHAGDVCLGPRGEVTGRPLEVLARLLDAAPARAALARAPEAVTASLLVSQPFYDDTVHHGHPGIEPEAFRRVSLAEKEYAADAWLYLPGHERVPWEPGPAGAPAQAGPGEPKMINKASGNGVVYATQNGTQNIHHGQR
ncbi:hypothetical protein ABZY93_01430 [Streptomyces smyrnaeus]|uniref:hypothetical protein n=1 Tax=Streptomyces smyrnaeus TaxID=1387713 RepID=UPI00339FF052